MAEGENANGRYMTLPNSLVLKSMLFPPVHTLGQTAYFENAERLLLTVISSSAPDAK
jgi:hypothetical protein